MTDTPRHQAGEAVTNLLFHLFRANNQVLTWGDRLVAGLGLTSARWQILGAIVAAEHAQPVSWLARDLGANRQNVQRIVNDLAKDGFVVFAPNPHHRRAQLVVLTDLGREIFDAANDIYNPRVNALSEGLSLKDIETASDVLKVLRQKVEDDANAL
ncbi:MAG: MarR family winged helix-turn-helix transcriptional regulator [Alphaproteobacteria bacterium]|nr:MarR family winged helix-turn-helix transcriptional regulator [Alphaproteobacteria bacterium]